VTSCPWLLPTLREHLDDQEGELLPHLFMADVERWAEAQFDMATPASRSRLSAVLEFLEGEFAGQGDSEVADLIFVSFLEHLPRAPSSGAGLRSIVGPACQRALAVIG